MHTPVLNALPDHQIPLWNFLYLACGRPKVDPTIIWGTDIDTTGLNGYLREANETAPVIVTAAHVLLQAVATSLARHPEFNRRVIRGHIYPFRQINLLMPLQKRVPREADVILLENVDRKSLHDIAREVWHHEREATRGEFETDREPPFYLRMPRRLMYWLYPLHLFAANCINLPAGRSFRRQRTAVALVNYFGFHGAAPMRFFKPSRYPNDSCLINVTMGPARPTPVVVKGEVVARPVAPLTIRADHRVVDAYQVGRFVATLAALLTDPRGLESQPPAAEAGMSKPAIPAMA